MMHMGVSILMLTVLLPHIAINYNIRSIQLHSYYSCFSVYFSNVYRTPIIIIISVSYYQQYLVILHGHTLLQPGLINYWLIQTLNTGDCLYSVYTSMEMLYLLNCNSKLRS